MWQLLFLLFNTLAVYALPVFTFNFTIDDPSSTSPSFASLVTSDLNLPNNFTICSSIKQAMFDDVGFYTVFGEDSSEWLTVKFHSRGDETIQMSLRWDGKWHLLKRLWNPRLDYWYHVCLGIDLTKTELEAAVNGVLLGKAVDRKITNIPSKLQMDIGRGQDREQFQGWLGNLRIFKEGNALELSAEPCLETGQSTLLLAWDPIFWKAVGSSWLLTEESDETICRLHHDSYNVAIPSWITINESLDLCKQKLNNSIIPFQEDLETFLKYVAWHRNTTGSDCPYIWTPLSDEQDEGIFLNMNNNVEAEFQIWDGVEPNGGEDENFVMIEVSRGVLLDVSPTKLICSSCLLSTSLLLQMDGLCEDSLIGDILPALLEFFIGVFIADNRYKMLNSQSLIGFNGWQNIYIRFDHSPPTQMTSFMK